MNLLPVTFADVVDATARIGDRIHHTPVATSATLRRELGADVFFKCENLQKVGAFKARGATNAVLSLTDEEAQRGVVTHSSGNHGQALAFAAAQRGIAATVVMPHHAPAVKKEAVAGYGATIELCDQTERQAVCERIAAATGAAIIHPFDDPRVIAGQGTAALELFADVPDLDVVVAPIGGGGLLSGTALVAAEYGAAAIGSEPQAVDDAYRSLESGIRQPAVTDPQTLGDGLLTGIGDLAFRILTGLDASIITVSEDAMLEAARFHLFRMKLLVEPSGATALAALRTDPGQFRGKRVGVILSGGNTDLRWL